MHEYIIPIQWKTSYMSSYVNDRTFFVYQNTTMSNNLEKKTIGKGNVENITPEYQMLILLPTAKLITPRSIDYIIRKQINKY